MFLPRMSIRRWMQAVAIAGLLAWMGIAWREWGYHVRLRDGLLLVGQEHGDDNWDIGWDPTSIGVLALLAGMLLTALRVRLVMSARHQKPPVRGHWLPVPADPSESA